MCFDITVQLQPTCRPPSSLFRETSGGARSLWTIEKHVASVRAVVLNVFVVVALWNIANVHLMLIWRRILALLKYFNSHCHNLIDFQARYVLHNVSIMPSVSCLRLSLLLASDRSSMRVLRSNFPLSGMQHLSTAGPPAFMPSPKLPARPSALTISPPTR
jgi:hypothetical protein